MNQVAQIIANNLARIDQRIADAAARSGRPRESVRLVGVTKYSSDAITAAIAAAGCQDLGESRPQSLWSKVEWMNEYATTLPPVRWHMIGHLQTNKLRRTLPLIHTLHAGDSLKLLAAMNTVAGELELPIAPRVLLEVNISGDANKHGFLPRTLEEALPTLAEFQNLAISGLMGMSGLESDAAQTRREFAQLRILCDRLQQGVPAHLRLSELSMGMSDDFEVAIEEGATLVRIGSALVEGLSAEELS